MGRKKKNKKNMEVKAEKVENKTEKEDYVGFKSVYTGCDKHPVVNIPGCKGKFTGGRRNDQTQKASMVVLLDSIGAMKFNFDSLGKLFCSNPQRIVKFEIADQGVPKDVVAFKDLLWEIQTELNAGGHVHVQCIGGHGRTGLVLACLVGRMVSETEIADPVKWVRENYCKEAVESKIQHEMAYEIGGRKLEVPKSDYISPYAYTGTGISDYEWDVKTQRWLTKKDKQDEVWDWETGTWKSKEVEKKDASKKDDKTGEEDIDGESDSNDRTDLNKDYPPYTRDSGLPFSVHRYWGNHRD